MKNINGLRTAYSTWHKFIGSVWLFPTIVILAITVCTVFRISGTSEGNYQFIFYGPKHDNHLLTGQPRSIRSDEWMVMTQMVIAQKEAGYPSTNKNIGNGQNMNVILDVPTNDWSNVLKPQNWMFRLLPFENAFAFRWWFPAGLVLLSAYFLSLFFMPKRRLIASMIALSLYFSAFIQWWYLGITLGTIGYSLVLLLLYLHMLRTDSTKSKTLYSIGIAYSLLCFMILLYPPFQIPCSITAAAFAVGYTLYAFPDRQKLGHWLRSNLKFFAAILVVVGAVTTLFAVQNISAITAIENSAYPGRRIVESGGYSKSHLLSGQVAYQHLRQSVSASYTVQPNQSESSTFMFLGLFMFIPFVYIIARKRKFGLKTTAFPIAVSIGLVGLIFLLWLFIPHMSLLGAVTKLNLVPLNRLIIGLGLLNTLATIIFIYVYSQARSRIRILHALVFAAVLFLGTWFVNKSIQLHSPGFIGDIKSVAFALPMAASAFLILIKRFEAGILILTSFIIFSNAPVNPLYQGLGPVTNNPLYTAISTYRDHGSRWIFEDIQYENFAIIAGKKSLSGVFFYPQKELWQIIDNGKSELLYNRYAHVGFLFDHDTSVTSPTAFLDTSADRLLIQTELCSDFIRTSDVRQVVSSATFSSSDQHCIQSIRTVQAGDNKFYIYGLAF